MAMILYSEKSNPQYNQNSVLTMCWIAMGRTPPWPRDCRFLSTSTVEVHRKCVPLTIQVRFFGPTFRCDGCHALWL